MSFEDVGTSSLVVFYLVYFTLFLDNVLLTVIVPIVPLWLEEFPSLWWWSGLTLGAKAGSELFVSTFLSAPLVVRFGCVKLSQVGVLLLGLGSVGLYLVQWRCAILCRIVQGVGSALSGMGGVSLVSLSLAPSHRAFSLSLLYTAVAAGVLVGYVGGSLSAQYWPEAPFLVIALLFALDLGLQYKYLSHSHLNFIPAGESGNSCSALLSPLMRWSCAIVFLATFTEAALEPCLPSYVDRKYHEQHWSGGVLFVADSLGYLCGSVFASLCSPGGSSPENEVGLVLMLSALAVAVLPHLDNMWLMCICLVVVGSSAGVVDGLVPPFVVSRNTSPSAVAAFHAAANAAYFTGPALGGFLCSSVGLRSLLHGISVILITFAVAIMYRQPIKFGFSEESAEKEDYTNAIEMTQWTPIIDKNKIISYN